MAKKRSIKVISQSGHNYKATPTIMLKGQWLKELGFDIGDYVSITCENGKLVITPDAEKMCIRDRDKCDKLAIFLSGYEYFVKHYKSFFDFFSIPHKENKEMFGCICYICD